MYDFKEIILERELYKSELLYKAIDDNQNTIRFTDTKASAVLLVVGIFLTISSYTTKDFFLFLKLLLKSDQTINLVFLGVYVTMCLIAITLMLLSIKLAFLTISPKSGPVSSVDFDLEIPKQNLYYMFELQPKVNHFNIFKDKEGYFKLKDKASQIMDGINHLDDKRLNELLIYELQMVSFIREIKINRVKYSIKCLLFSGGIFALTLVVFIAHKIIY